MNQNPPPPPVLAAVALPEAPRARTLHLVTVGPSPVLLASATARSTFPHSVTEIWAFPLAGQGPSGAVTSVQQLLPPPPLWDARADETGALRFAMELAGGAVTSVFLLNSASGQRASITEHRPFGTFTGPRFVRGKGPGTPPISAILDSKQAVVLAPPGGSGPPEREIGECMDAVVVARSTGATLVCKRVAPGPARENVMPGTVLAQPLDADLRPTGAAALPFGDRKLFEIDADRDGEGLAIVATSAGQLLFAHRPAEGAAFQVTIVGAGSADARTFTSPSVVVSQRRVTVAVLANALTPNAQALTATWTLDAPP